MLEFCVDVYLYLAKDKMNMAAVHCKAGKGRTGVMICAYLLFSGICKNALEAFKNYAERRSHSRKVSLYMLIPRELRYHHSVGIYITLRPS
jgi:phosphatidylinositol-3,4,5-trisphosphate 3-phosphatase/dual-specificity protein phosphatase PTEN